MSKFWGNTVSDIEHPRNQLMEETVNSVLASMSSVKKPQRLLLTGLFSVLRLFQGKATFRNLSRSCPGKRVFKSNFCFMMPNKYTGLMECQARCKEAIQMQANASLTAPNLLKLEDRRQKQTTQETMISIAA